MTSATFGWWFAAIATTANAAYPDKPIRIIVPYVPGGNIDITARTLAPGLGEALGQTIVVENRGGAGGTIGTEIAAKAPADGYTLLLGSSGTLTNAPALYPKLGYDPLKDFATTSMTTMVPIVIETHPSVAVKTVREFIALPVATPADVVMKVHAALVKVLRTKATGDSFARFGAETLERSPEEFAKFIREDLAKWSRLVRETGIKLE